MELKTSPPNLGVVRERERRAVAELPGPGRLLKLTRAGGAGKTRLALEAAL